MTAGSIGPSIRGSLSSNAIKAIGERIVANELTFRGWLAVNANSGEENSPNVDLMALRGDKRVTIQVKTSSARSNEDQHFMGYYKEQGAYFNAKPGPTSDFVVSVYVNSPTNYRCLVLPVGDAERMCKLAGEHWMNVPKKDGGRRSPNFRILLSAGGQQIASFVDAWHLLE